MLFQPAAAVTPRIQALADEIAASIDDRREQTRRLHGWIGRHVRWVAVYLGNGSFVPHGADAVLANGYGDCKDQVALLIALLRAKGIDAEPMAINLSPSYTLSDAVTYSAFNHVITCLPEWQLYADTTPGRAPFGTLPFSEYGKPMLHITLKGEAPGRMPMLLPAGATERLHTLANLLADGTVTSNSKIDAAGADEHIEASFTLDAQPEWLDGGAIPLPTGLRLLSRTGDPLIGLTQQRGVPDIEPTPCCAGRQDEELSLTLPTELRPIRLPKDVTLDGAFFRYESRWQFADHATTARRSLVSTFDQPLCKSPQRSETIPAMAAIRRDLKVRVIPEKAG